MLLEQIKETFLFYHIIVVILLPYLYLSGNETSSLSQMCLSHNYLLILSFDRIHFLERKHEDLQKCIAGFCDQKDPVIFLFDNINLYKSQHTHTRITDAKRVPLWNFLV